MKKLSMFIVLVIVIFTLSACGTKINYTKEYPYLPAYDGMTNESFTPPTNEVFGQAIYTVKDAKYENLLEKYEKILKKDGWKVTQDDKPGAITVEKDNHKAVIVPQMNKDTIKLFILSK